MFAHPLFRSGTSVGKLPGILFTSNKPEVPQHKWIVKTTERTARLQRLPEEKNRRVGVLYYGNWYTYSKCLKDLVWSRYPPPQHLKQEIIQPWSKDYCHHVVTTTTCGSKYCSWFSTCCFPLALTDQLARQLATEKDQVLAYWWNWGCLNIVLLTKQMRPSSSSNCCSYVKHLRGPLLLQLYAWP